MRTTGTAVENNFLNGFITEATGINFPEAAVSDCSNVVINTDGSIERRLGFDFDTSGNLINWTDRLADGSGVQTSYLWTSVGGDGNVNVLVRQAGSAIYLYNISSTGVLTFSDAYDLNNVRTSASFNPGLAKCSFASGKGYLFVSNQYCNPFYVKRVTSTTHTYTTIDLQQRDFEGVDDGMSVRQRINTLSATHRYNLYNQGWFKKRADNSGAYSFPIDRFFTTVGLYPSNADIVTLYLNVDDQTAFAENIYRKPVGLAKAPGGFFILPCFNLDRTAAVNAVNDEGNAVPTITAVTSGNLRPSCVAFYAGRVFYAGTPAQGFSDKVYFSELITGNSSFGKCYQVNDPTSDDNPDLLATDGGVISINDIGTVYALFPTQRALVVFASNGIWTISGTETAPFKATDYSVYKISSVSNSNPDSIVDVFGNVIFWNKDGIWSFAADQSGNTNVTSVSDKKIKSFLNSLPSSASQWASGDFNPKSKIVQWMYRSSTAPTTLDNQTYNKVLSLDLTSGSFYIYTLPIDDYYRPCGIKTVYTKDYTSTFKYMMISTPSLPSRAMSFAEEKDTSYKDWTSLTGGIDYTSYFKSGYKLNAEANKKFQDNYVTFYMEKKGTSSALVSGAWDFVAARPDSRITPQQQIYPTDDSNVSTTQKRLKIRGWGRELNFWVDSESGKPFSIYGWSCNVSGNATA